MELAINKEKCNYLNMSMTVLWREIHRESDRCGREEVLAVLNRMIRQAGLCEKVI